MQTAVLPPPLLPVKNRLYTAGEFELSGNRRMYISRGVGHMIKVRFNVRPEVTVFVLEAADRELSSRTLKNTDRPGPTSQVL